MTEATSERIADRCPSCGHSTLFVGASGYLTCSWLPCQEPGVGRAVKSLQDRLERVGVALAEIHKLRRHSCSNCGLTDEEYAEIAGYNEAVKECEALIRGALTGASAVDGGRVESSEAAVPSKP
jgi:ribosomal protein S27AE